MSKKTIIQNKNCFKIQTPRTSEAKCEVPPQAAQNKNVCEANTISHARAAAKCEACPKQA